MIETATAIELIIVGFSIGILAALVGIGGGLIAVPILFFVFKLELAQASAISTVVIVFTSLSSGITFWRQKRIDIRTGMYFASLSVPAALIGASLGNILDESVLTLLFGILMILVSIKQSYTNCLRFTKKKEYIKKKDKEIHSINNLHLNSVFNFIPQKIENRLIIDNEGKKFYYQVKFRKALGGAFIGGFIGGLLGVGGGVIFVPVLTSIGGLPAHIGLATSTFIIIFTAISGSISRILFGPFQNQIWLYEYVLFLAIGTVTGARLGALKVRRISSEKILILFYITVFIAGLRTIASGLGLFS